MAKNEEVVEAVDESTEMDNYRPMDVESAITGLNNPTGAFYSSIKQDDFAGKKKVAAAITSSQPISDHLNEDIELVDVIVQSVQIADQDSGEVNDAPRVTLIDVSGNAYHATSSGLLSAVRSLISVLGEPGSWPEPVTVRAVEERGRRGYRFMTLKF